ncbi:3-hydroxyacyl-CoA dehydrogenase NAD-binding domain-containing protein [Thioalkalivibrio sp. XN279]|uniref:3-hydroxyacyl-CoA dehydrogenase NAD-binding domain-containing protein n=1 Tax=Thioalkalivibrio sp. XN279 TaxID=2714953 RepID=UPI0014079D4A|nr:3-hydroxyacyl-CoA dehydrogenase NAD-binding domain-containing protein [Thioalkalivibrio sp. XN279]NHA14447.1 crotonase [Thioalkalivibrio sp. XN279]
MNDTLKNWTLRRDDDGIAWLCFDKADASTNVLSRDVMVELNTMLEAIEKDLPKAVVVTSGKKSGFVAGADIKEFTGLKDSEQAYEMVRAGQQVLDRLEALKCPTIALINGFALGGGLELALACRYRIINDDPKTVIGLPEVKLGIHPGFGGTVRSVQLAGPLKAMDMMLTGKNIRPKPARAMGLVDQVVPARHLERAARMMALKPPRPRQLPLQDKLMNLGPARNVLAGVLEKQVAKKARRDHYPAPYAIIDLWKRYGDKPALMMEKEARSIAELFCTDTSRNLVRVFLLQDKLKALGGKTRHQFKHVHVVGAGVMGGDIAVWCALRGMTVTLQDREPKYIAPVIKRAAKLYQKKLREPRLVQAALDRLMPDVEGRGVAGADVVIEAIFEDAEAKKALFRDLEPRMKPDAVLATNTSSIRLEDLQDALDKPGRLIGLHFFNPVAMMPLVEVIHTPDTPQAEIDKGIAFARKIDKLPLPCLSSPGFVVNRVLMPYMMEALLAGEDGVPMPLIDSAAKRFGMPMGPVELADTVGLDVALHVAKILGAAYGIPVPDRLVEMVDKKRLGRKTGRGFYEWKDGKAVKPQVKDATPPQDLADRLVLPMVNECVAVWRDGVVTDLDLLDAGVIFGTGFAPFRGGPINFARARGVADVVESLQRLEERYGERFAPDPGWKDLPR